MKNRCVIHLLLVGLMGYFALPLAAQEEAPASRWTVGAELGFSLKLLTADGLASGVANERMAASYHVLGGQLNYRFRRWLGLTSQLGLGRYRTQSADIVRDYNQDEGYPVQRTVALDAWTVSIGPQLFFRIGQGDLGLAWRGGAALRTVRVGATSYYESDLRLRYHPKLSFFQAWRIGYTYWPRVNYGVTLALESTKIRTDTSDDFRIRSQSGTVHPDSHPDAVTQLTPWNDGPASRNLVLGFICRF